MEEKKTCSGCKKKSIFELNDNKVEEDNSKLIKVLIFVYTILTAYGLISLILDIKTFIYNLL
jgi:hypothetical protein